MPHYSISLMPKYRNSFSSLAPIILKLSTNVQSRIVNVGKKLLVLAVLPMHGLLFLWSTLEALRTAGLLHTKAIRDFERLCLVVI